MQDQLSELSYGYIPNWMGYLPFVFSALLAFVIGYVAMKLGTQTVMIAYSSTKVTHWTERARGLFPLRQYHTYGLVLIALTTSILITELIQRGITYTNGWLLHLLVLTSITFGGGIAIAQNGRRYGLSLTTFGQYAYYAVGTLLIFYPGMAVGFVTSFVEPYLIESWIPFWHALRFLIVLVVTIKGAIPLLRLTGIATKPDRRTLDIVRSACERMQLPVPRVYTLNLPTTNAFAFPSTNDVAFTQKIQDLLNDEELTGVSMHELAHLTEPFRIKMMHTGIDLCFSLGIPLIAPLSNALGQFPAYAVVLFLFYLGVFGKGRLRKQERRADEMCIAHQKQDGSYAVALEKLHEAELIPAVLQGVNKTHPDLYDRMMRAGKEPGYVKPEPPVITRMIQGTITASLLSVLLSCVFIMLVRNYLPKYLSGNPGAAMAVLAATGGNYYGLIRLSQYSARHGDIANKHIYDLAAYALEPDDFSSHLNYAETFADNRQCEEARLSLGRAIEKTKILPEYSDDFVKQKIKTALAEAHIRKRCATATQPAQYP